MGLYINHLEAFIEKSWAHQASTIITGVQNVLVSILLWMIQVALSGLFIKIDNLNDFNFNYYVLVKFNRNCCEGLVPFASVKFDSSTAHCNEPLIFHFLHLIEVQSRLMSLTLIPTIWKVRNL